MRLIYAKFEELIAVLSCMHYTYQAQRGKGTEAQSCLYFLCASVPAQSVAYTTENRYRGRCQEVMEYYIEEKYPFLVSSILTRDEVPLRVEKAMEFFLKLTRIIHKVPSCRMIIDVLNN